MYRSWVALELAFCIIKEAGILQSKEVIEFNISVNYFADVERTVSNL